MAYNLMVPQKQYMEIPLTDEQAKMVGATTDPSATWETLPPDSLNGKKCDRYKITTTNPADATQKMVSILYVDPATKGPIRVVTGEGQDAMVMDYKNFKIGASDPTLFSLPAGYTKFSIPAIQPPKPAAGQ
jgi:hypothetical protein